VWHERHSIGMELQVRQPDGRSQRGNGDAFAYKASVGTTGYLQQWFRGSLTLVVRLVNPAGDI
jgi:hypothetical protein